MFNVLLFFFLNSTKFNLVLIYYFYINCCILDVNKCINLNERLDPCQGYCDGSINSEIGVGWGGGEFRLGSMLQFITICASSRVGLLNRRLKSVRMYRWMILRRGHVRQFCGWNSVNKIHRYVLHCRELFPQMMENHRCRSFVSTARIFETINEHVNIRNTCMVYINPSNSRSLNF